ncbi:methyltransferase [Actinokineospora bangkokensis]|uniref:Methyltransferase n=1 Tax=Actinokineospora bangkokensis TaxID=1193682 RepID=A0A1Q9LHK9_9PSEU|nr:class I SAM-dependent methyltransferase [Actinokineospora bangkokensis]OLR91506.1 methyltransferase [Actinokineospora bangkokensis]
MDDYLSVNRANWDERAPAHAKAQSYGVARYRADPDHLSDVVRFDRELLGDVSGLRGVHLQCHIGTDTLSLHRLGARMSGLDFSAASLAEARSLAASTGADIDYHESDVYSALDVLEPGGYDLVYTGVGALCWLPSIERWADVVAGLLRPGGRLFVRDGHPVLYSLDETREPLTPRFPYFERAEPLVWEEAGTYADADSRFEHTTTHSWNHGLGETVTALLDRGFQLTRLVEHRSAPWEALPGHMVLDDVPVLGGAVPEWRLRDERDRIPLTFTAAAVRP